MSSPRECVAHVLGAEAAQLPGDEQARRVGDPVEALG
jgi:hypothetical protein